jgi:hypothetical protein
MDLKPELRPGLISVFFSSVAVSIFSSSVIGACQRSGRKEMRTDRTRNGKDCRLSQKLISTKIPNFWLSITDRLSRNDVKRLLRDWRPSHYFTQMIHKVGKLLPLIGEQFIRQFRSLLTRFGTVLLMLWFLWKYRFSCTVFAFRTFLVFVQSY